MAIELNLASPLETKAAPADKSGSGAAVPVDATGAPASSPFNALLAQFDQATLGSDGDDKLACGAAADPVACATLPVEGLVAGLTGDEQSAPEVRDSSAPPPLPVMDPLALMSQMQVAQQPSVPQVSQGAPASAAQPLPTAPGVPAPATPGEGALSQGGFTPLTPVAHPAVKAGAEAMGVFDAQKQATSGRFELPSGTEGLALEGKKPTLGTKLGGAAPNAGHASAAQLLSTGAGDPSASLVSSADFSEWLTGRVQAAADAIKPDAALSGPSTAAPSHTATSARTELSPMGSWDFSTKGAGNAPDTQASSRATQASPEQQIADQVSVWVSQNVQSAELRMDAFGADRVEVSITMAGNEATVQFRSDVAETRDLLQRAAANLESALRADGLVLSGVSVGASSQGQDNAREASQNTHVFSRKPSVKPETMAEAGVRLVARPAVPQGRLDLYV